MTIVTFHCKTEKNQVFNQNKTTIIIIVVLSHLHLCI